jgi:hypothetical protein
MKEKEVLVVRVGGGPERVRNLVEDPLRVRS